MPLRSLAAIGALLLLGSLGCGTRYQRTLVQEQGGTKTLLRAELRGGGTVSKGYAHPVTIAGVRIAHILASIDYSEVESSGTGA